MSTLARRIVQSLLRFGNVVLEGPPGTGKTFAAAEVASIWQSETGRQLGGAASGDFAITMHPSTSYEDFVEGLRYDESKGAFAGRPGFILRVVEKALSRPDEDFLVLLDEINRSNVPKVLGDLLLTMELSKRRRWDKSSLAWLGGQEVTLPYSGSNFVMPANVFLLATMNTSDRSIAPLDVALRRRFAFMRVDPLQGSELVAALEASKGDETARALEDSVTMMARLNERVLKPVLGPDGQLGHSYFFDIDLDVEGLPSEIAALASPEVDRAFWVETRSGNGGSRNQLDVADKGASGHPGSLHLFYPLKTSTGVVNSPDRDRADHLPIRVDGAVFENNVLRYNEPTPVWRLYLQGETSQGKRMSELASEIEPTADKPNARYFEYRIHLWAVDSSGVFELSRLDATPENIERLTSLSAWHDRTQTGANGRSYGLIDLQGLRSEASTDEPDQTWRYAILPQLVEFAVTAGVDELFDPATRSEWQAAHGAPADEAVLQDFDEFIGSMNLALRVVGHGLGRALMIVDVQGPTSAVAAATSPSSSPAEDDVSDEAAGE